MASAALAPSALCGEVDRPLPIWLTAMMKYRSGFSACSGPTYTSRQIWWVPEYQVVMRIALSLASFSSPHVVTASWQSGIEPPSSRSSRPTLISS